ncbi:MAG: DNA repair protein RecN [Chloroflexi bacterium]|nr:DNA repair protein RecN [Chloroflexota bacterium]
MLTELMVTNFAIIHQLRLGFAPGFTVLTGETGAGKSIIIDALSLALGGRASEEMIRSEAGAARVEAVFSLDHVPESFQRVLEEHGIECEDSTLILSREIVRGGRSITRINARAVPLRVLEQVGEWLVDIHGQSEHLSLKNTRTHIDYLDRFADLWDERAVVASKVKQVAEVRRELESLLRDERELARRVDLLTFQIEEISAAGLRPGEDENLKKERQRLANAEKLAQFAEDAYNSLRAGDDDRESALDRLGETQHTLAQLIKIDAALAVPAQQLEDAVAALEDVAATLRDYREAVEFNPARLAEVEDRLETIHNLKRKYGDSIEAVNAFGARAATDLDAITHSAERIAALRESEGRLLQELARLASALSAERKAAAQTMAAGIERELADLRMIRAKFVVDFQRHEDAQGVPLDGRRYAVNATGVDRVEFLVSANPGEPPKPLAKVASGGETARLMLALKSVLSAADQVPTLVFDEIDVGIGGRVGAVVGRKLWNLTLRQAQDAANDGAASAPAHQVVCITHLPQIAAFGDTHYRVDKDIEGDHTTTALRRLDGDERVGELAQMLGAVGEAGEQSAAEILRAAEQEKQDTQP